MLKNRSGEDIKDVLWNGKQLTDEQVEENRE